MVLQKIGRETILCTMLRSVPGKQYKVLILDDHTKLICSAVARMQDITSCNIATVDKLEINRQPINLEAIYFIEPYPNNFEIILNDFAITPKYKAAHIFVTEPVSNDIVLSLRKIKKYLLSYREVNFSFVPLSSNAFHLNKPELFQAFYDSRLEKLREALLTEMASQLVTVCVSLCNLPNIVRYRKQNGLNCELANKFKEKMKEFVRENPSQSWYSTSANLILLDRGFDTITPALHDLTLEPMARDMLQIGTPSSPDKYTYWVSTKQSKDEKEEKVAYLDDCGEMWEKYRFLFINEAASKVGDDLKTFTKKNVDFGEVVNTCSTAKFQYLLKKSSYQRKEQQQFGFLSNMAFECLSKYNGKLCALEQSLAIDVVEEGSTIDSQRLIKVKELLICKTLNQLEKLRLIFLYSSSINKGIRRNVLEELFLLANIPQHCIPAVTNFRHLNVPILKSDSLWQNHIPQARYEFPANEKRLENTKWCAVIYHLARLIIDSEKSKNKRENLLQQFPGIDLEVGESLKIQRLPNFSKFTGKFSKSASIDSTFDDGDPFNLLKKRGAIIIFVIGGISYAELKYAHMLTREDRVETIFGSSHVTTPNNYIEQVMQLT